MNAKRAVKGFFLSLVFLAILGSLFYSLCGIFERAGKFLPAALSEPAQKAVEPNLPQRNWQAEDLQAEAEAEICAEISQNSADKILFSKNSQMRLPIASLTKLMTAIVALDNYDMSQNIEASKEAALQSPVFNDLREGDILSVESLLHIMLIESSNRAAYALSEVMPEQQFVDLMNQKAEYIGLAGTYFEESTGLSDKNYSTASDLVKLAEYILENYPKIIDISRISEFEVPGFGKISSTNQLLVEMPEIIGGKTGFTTDAKGCIILVVYNQKSDDYLVYAVLGAEDRFLEMKKLINWVNTAYIW